jgi:hypothetical protein
VHFSPSLEALPSPKHVVTQPLKYLSSPPPSQSPSKATVWQPMPVNSFFSGEIRNGEPVKLYVRDFALLMVLDELWQMCATGTETLISLVSGVMLLTSYSP